MSGPVRDADWWAAVQVTRERAKATRRTLEHFAWQREQVAKVTERNARVGDFAAELAFPGRLDEVLDDWQAQT